ncbi:MAG: cupin domain-containing protein [Chlorobiaceae bacterium]|nr:cupin domain-containing protein [Chlorobiaceae bacterium]
MQKAEFWIEHLQLVRHPEGGYYRETYRSSGSYAFTNSILFHGSRSYATAIYYLLNGREHSKLHRIHSDELWFFHAGNPLNIYIFPKKGEPSSFTLGLSAEKGEILQETVPAESWFGASLENPEPESYSLVSCVVAPGFEFRDFTFADRMTLLKKFPKQSNIIERLT